MKKTDKQYVTLVIGHLKFQVPVEGIRLGIKYTDLRMAMKSFKVPCYLEEKKNG